MKMQSSPYRHAVPAILAEMENERQEDDNQQPAQEEPEQETVYVYRTEGGGVYFSPTLVGEPEPEAPIVDSTEPVTDTRPTNGGEPPYFLHVLLIFFLFLFLDSADATLTALMTPTATITITPQVKTITLQSALKLGKVLSPITVSQSQTVPATGHGHQDARAATGTITFYNSAFSSQIVDAGTILTGSDGGEVTTDATVTIPADNPPVNGQASVSAHAVNPGSNGNIPALDINGMVSNSLYVKNLTPFTNGQDARDFQIVRKADIDRTAQVLTAKVSSSMAAALQGQTTPGEQVRPIPCTPTTSADHRPGDEAETVDVTVSETCIAIAYNTQELTDQATKLLTTQAVQTLGTGYLLYGNMKVSVTKANAAPNNTAVLSFTTQGTYVYQLTAKVQERIVTLVAGKPRETALQQLATLPGIQTVSITGIPDNQQLPTDAAHIHLSIFYFVS